MYLEVQGLKKAFGHEAVLGDITLKVPRNSTLSILGRSGSGKTTLLKVMAGLEKPDGGQILLDGRKVTHISPQQRNMVYLYQEPLLFPHLNVFENVAFGLRIRKVRNPELRARTHRMLSELGLGGHARKTVRQLSGGQRQRVAFGRALIIKPSVLLLDEPFGALDSETRSRMQKLLKRVMREFQMTAIFVTHDLKEALVMGDQIGLMSAGGIRCYQDLNAFLGSPHGGLEEEMAFWASIQERKSRPGKG